MQLRYHEEAERKGVYIVGSCGFDSIPADLGSMVLAKAMGGDVATIETFLKVIVPDMPGPMINFATWQSAIHGFAHAKELQCLPSRERPNARTLFDMAGCSDVAVRWRTTAYTMVVERTPADTTSNPHAANTTIHID